MPTQMIGSGELDPVSSSGKKKGDLPTDRDEENITGVINLLAPGQVIKLAHHYTLVEKLGEGGMGEVWLAKFYLWGKELYVAVKILDKKEMPSGDAVKRFHREAYTLYLANHANIVKYRDYWEDEHKAYLVMESAQGVNLEEFIAKNDGPISVFPAISFILPILKALEYMYHSHGMHHRDIKPSNIQVVKKAEGQYETMLIDFGNAKIIEDDPNGKSLTMISGQMSGTPGYVAPEVTLDNYQEEDDVFSIACTMLYCLLGENPFQVTNNFADSYKKILEGKLKLGVYENTPIGNWLRINTALKRADRMTLSEAIRSLERIIAPEAEEKTEAKELRPLPSRVAETAEEEMQKDDEMEKISSLIDSGIEPERRRRSRRLVLLTSSIFLFLVVLAGVFWYLQFRPAVKKAVEPAVKKSAGKKAKTVGMAKKIVQGMAVAMAQNLPRQEKLPPSIKDLPRYKSVKAVYKELWSQKRREQLLLEAEGFYTYGHSKQDKKSLQQAEWRWLAFFRKAPVKDNDKLPVIRKLFSYYCENGEKKQARLMAHYFKKLGAKTQLLCP